MDDKITGPLHGTVLDGEVRVWRSWGSGSLQRLLVEYDDWSAVLVFTAGIVVRGVARLDADLSSFDVLEFAPESWLDLEGDDDRLRACRHVAAWWLSQSDLVSDERWVLVSPTGPAYQAGRLIDG